MAILLIGLLLFFSLASASFKNSFYPPDDLTCYPYALNAMFSPGICKCYNDGYGVDRKYMISAISDACLYFSNYVFGASATTDASYAYYYSIADDDEEGIVTVYLGYYAGENGQSRWCEDFYPDGINVSYNDCYNAMHNPIDHCDTGGEDHKQGGFAVDYCLAYTVDPNPKINEPDRVIPSSWNPVLVSP